MLQASKEVIDKIMETNTIIGTKYKFLDILEKNVLENELESNGLKIRQMSKLMETEMKDLSRGRGIIGVDGSINTIGSSYPHYISVMQALAKNTDRNYKDIFLADVHTPILNETELLFTDHNNSVQDTDEKIKSAKMAKLELLVADKALDQMDASIIMMDGSLIRYKIYCGEDWDRFVEKALQKNIYVLGVIEEIKTKDLSQILNIFPKDITNIYDREILFGKLEEGQMLELVNVKEGRGLKKCFMRTSKDPHAIGMDILEEQADKLDSLADLVYTLTPESGRGIPLWLDIVDSEVRISNKLVDSLVNTYIDPAYRKRFFTAKRDNRVL